MNHPGPANEETLIAGEVMKRQLLLERIADAACELYASSCTLSRLDHLLTLADGSAGSKEREADIGAGRYFLRIANRRIQLSLAALWDNDDEGTTQTADAVLGILY